MQRNRTQRWKLIVATVAMVGLLAMVSGCPDGSLLGLVGENGEPDTNANLSALTVTQGELYPPFNPATTEYEVSLDSGVSSVVVTGTAAAAGATVSNNSGTSQTLESGANPITITVTAGDGTTTKAYVVTVNRGAVGTVDASFDPGDGANSRVLAVALQSDEKIVIGGSFFEIDGTLREGIARLNADGALESDLDVVVNAMGGVHAITVHGDGRILIAGGFTSVDGEPRDRIARLNEDGALDTTFNPGTGANWEVVALAVQSDGMIVIGGGFTSFNGVTRNGIARLDASGSLDAGFDPDANDALYAIALQNDGKIVIGGSFWQIGGTRRNHIARLNDDGSLDNAFDPGEGANQGVMAIALQSDGKIVIGGDFTGVNDVPRNRIARLNSVGSLDYSFNPDANGTVNAIAVQSDGKIVIGGDFTEVGGQPRNRIARLNSDGSLDTSFDLGSGASHRVLSLAVQSDGKILIAGDFTSIGGVIRNRIARLR